MITKSASFVAGRVFYPWRPSRPLMRPIALCCALLLAPASAAPWWPFSWRTLPVHAFPGAAARFLTAQEVTNTSRFAFINVWGLNGTCVNASSGAAFPAHCGSSHCSCAATAATPP